MTLPFSWRFVRTAPADGAWNMACDLALMALARADGLGILRVYDWSAPTVSFGRHERTAGIYSPETLAQAGLQAVRRPTGGRALLHSREVTYSIAMPISDNWRWTMAYDLVNRRLLQAMLALQIPARIVDGPASTGNPGLAPTPHAESHVCFSGIASGEIAVGEQKLIASAVWRERGAYLQHGSIQIHDDQHLLTPLLGNGRAAPERAAVLSNLLPANSEGDTFDLVKSSLRVAFEDCGKLVPWSIPTDVLVSVGNVRSELEQSSWLWRR